MIASHNTGDPRAAGAGAGDTGAGGAGTGEVGAGDTGTVDLGAGGAGAGGAVCGGTGAEGTGRPRPFFVPLFQQVLGLPSSTSFTSPLLWPPPDLSQPPLQLASPLPAACPYTEQTGGPTARREPESQEDDVNSDFHEEGVDTDEDDNGESDGDNDDEEENDDMEDDDVAEETLPKMLAGHRSASKTTSNAKDKGKAPATKRSHRWMLRATRHSGLSARTRSLLPAVGSLKPI
ncbi:unnamed protein product [Closterium sp. NIES-53]